MRLAPVDELGANERGFLDRNPGLAYGYFQAQTQANEVSQRVYPGVDHKDDRVDSLRHALWSGYLVLEGVHAGLSPQEAALKAKEFGKDHEWDHFNGLPDQRMDMYNNSAGRNVATSPPRGASDCSMSMSSYWGAYPPAGVADQAWRTLAKSWSSMASSFVARDSNVDAVATMTFTSR